MDIWAIIDIVLLVVGTLFGTTLLAKIKRIPREIGEMSAAWAAVALHIVEMYEDNKATEEEKAEAKRLIKVAIDESDDPVKAIKDLFKKD